MTSPRVPLWTPRTLSCRPETTIRRIFILSHARCSLSYRSRNIRRSLCDRISLKADSISVAGLATVGRYIVQIAFPLSSIRIFSRAANWIVSREKSERKFPSQIFLNIFNKHARFTARMPMLTRLLEERWLNIPIINMDYLTTVLAWICFKRANHEMEINSPFLSSALNKCLTGQLNDNKDVKGEGRAAKKGRKNNLSKIVEGASRDRSLHANVDLTNANLKGRGLRGKPRRLHTWQETHGVLIEDSEDEGGELWRVTLGEELLVDLYEALKSRERHVIWAFCSLLINGGD